MPSAYRAPNSKLDEEINDRHRRLYYSVPGGLASAAGATGSLILGGYAARRAWDAFSRPSGVSFAKPTLVDRATRYLPPLLTGISAVRHGRSAVRQGISAAKQLAPSWFSARRSAAKYAPGRSHLFQHWRTSSRPRKFIRRGSRYGRLSYGGRRSYRQRQRR